MPFRPLAARTPEEWAAFFDQVVGRMPHYVVIGVDLENRINLWNRGAERIFQYEEREILGRDCSVLYNPEDRAQGIPLQEIERARLEGSAPDLRWHRRKDGSSVWIVGVVVPWFAADGTLRGFIKWGEDGTERRRTDEALQRQLAVLEDFIGHAAHDLRSPLRTIRNLLQLVDEDHGEALPGDVRDLLGRAERASGDLDRLVGELLAYVRLGQYKPDPCPTDLNVVFDAVVAALEADIEAARGVVVRESLPEVTADAMLLRRVLQNLVANALSHRGQAPPVIVVRYVRRPGEIEVHVDDNGPGIPPDRRERIFEPLERGDRQGFGLGLAICRRIIDAHGGRIWV
jgi:PAS domain S-box-containing protein